MWNLTQVYKSTKELLHDTPIPLRPQPIAMTPRYHYWGGAQNTTNYKTQTITNYNHLSTQGSDVEVDEDGIYQTCRAQLKYTNQPRYYFTTPGYHVHDVSTKSQFMCGMRRLTYDSYLHIFIFSYFHISIFSSPTNLSGNCQNLTSRGRRTCSAMRMLIHGRQTDRCYCGSRPEVPKLRRGPLVLKLNVIVWSKGPW